MKDSRLKGSRSMINCASRSHLIASRLYSCSITFDMFGRNTNYHICDVSQLRRAVPANVLLISRFDAFRLVHRSRYKPRIGGPATGSESRGTFVSIVRIYRTANLSRVFIIQLPLSHPLSLSSLGKFESRHEHYSFFLLFLSSTFIVPR